MTEKCSFALVCIASYFEWRNETVKIDCIHNIMASSWEGVRISLKVSTSLNVWKLPEVHNIFIVIKVFPQKKVLYSWSFDVFYWIQFWCFLRTEPVNEWHLDWSIKSCIFLKLRSVLRVKWILMFSKKNGVRIDRRVLVILRKR